MSWAVVRTWRGFIAAAANNGDTVGAAGSPASAYPARLLPIKVTKRDGGATWGDVASAVIYAADQGAAIISDRTPPARLWSANAQAAIDYAWNQGCFLVAPSARTGDSAHDLPGGLPPIVFGVGAVDGVGRCRGVFTGRRQRGPRGPGRR